MARTYVKIINECKRFYKDKEGEKVLCFQYCQYNFAGGETYDGYRFIWRKPDGKLQAARGQAMIPSIEVMHSMINEASSKGWGHHRSKLSEIKDKNHKLYE